MRDANRVRILALAFSAFVVACGRSQPPPPGAPATAVPVTPAPPPDLPDGVLLGILRADNLVTPIATYRRGGWTGPTIEQMVFGGEIDRGSAPPAWFVSDQPLASTWFRPRVVGGPMAVIGKAPVQIHN